MPHPNTPPSTTMLKKQSRSHAHPRGLQSSSSTSTSKSRPHTPPPADFYMRSGASPPSSSRKSHGHSRGASASQVPPFSSVTSILSPRPMSALDRHKMQEITTVNRVEHAAKAGPGRDPATKQPKAPVSNNAHRVSDKPSSALPSPVKTKPASSNVPPSHSSTRVSAQGEVRRQRSSSSAKSGHRRSEPSSADEDDETIHARLPIVEEI